MKKNFRLIGLDCAHCAAKIEDAVKKVDGVNDATVNFITTRLMVDVDDSRIDKILDQVAAVVKKTDSNVEMKKT